MLEHASFKHGFRLARTIGFRTENHIDSFIFKQKLICEHLDHSNKIVMHGTLCFAIENAAEPLGFKEKLCFKHVFSVQNRRVERQFQSKTEGAEAMHLTGLSQRHDFAKADDFEPLNL